MNADNILIAYFVITVANVLVAAGFAATGIARPEAIAPGDNSQQTRIFALYAAARALPLAFVTIVAVVLNATEAVIWLGVAAGITQLADAAIGLKQRDFRKTFGPVVIAVLQLAAFAALWTTGVV
ncbi:MAG TPA: hypothetical protein VL418_14685 [Devosiaceae bacterium]|nr:hypothetical protein [Devosiaceae bacterium]